MTVLVPTSIDEAVAALADPEAQLLAGGTDFMVEVNAGLRRLTAVVAVGRMEALRDWEQNRKQPDAPALAYLRVIAREPDMVARALRREAA